MVATVLAADLGGTKLAMAVFDAHGQALERVSVRVRNIDAGEVAATLERTLVGMRDRHQPRAVGLATIGVPNGANVSFAANLPGWETVSVTSLLASVGLPALTLNDVKAAALAEYRRGAGAGATSMLYINAGTGFAMALGVFGQVCGGAHGAAGEVGYWVRPGERLGARAGQAPLESRVGGWGVARRAESLGRPGEAREVAEASDEALSVLWEGVCVEVGIAVANAATLFDPEVVVLGGGMSQDERLVAEVSAALNRLVMFRPRLELAVFGRDAALVGASLAAWELSSQISGGPRSHDDPRTGQP